MKKWTTAHARTMTALVAGVMSAGLATAGENESFSSGQMAQIWSVYHNDSEPKASSTEQLTVTRISAINAAFDAVLEYQPEVDTLRASDMARISRAFDEALEDNQNWVMLDGKPVLLSAN